MKRFMATNIQRKWRKLVSTFDCASSLQVFLLFFRNCMQICIYSVTLNIDKDHWENLTLPMLPSSLPCSDWRGLLICIIFCLSISIYSYFVGLTLTKGNVQTVIQKSQVLESKVWPKTLRCFSLPAFDVMEHPLLTQKTQYLSESWFKTEEDQHWWRLGMKLIRCCKRQGIKTVHEFMEKVAIYNNDGKLHFEQV